MIDFFKYIVQNFKSEVDELKESRNDYEKLKERVKKLESDGKIIYLINNFLSS